MVKDLEGIIKYLGKKTKQENKITAFYYFF